MKPKRPQIRRGYLLVEMIVIIAIAAIALFVQARVFQAAMREVSGAPAIERQMLAINQISMMLRKDVWGASAITTPTATTAVLSYPDGRSVRWSFEPGATTRSDSADAGTSRQPQQWAVQSTLRIELDGAHVVLRGVSEREQSFVPERRFASQVMIVSQERQP